MSILWLCFGWIHRQYSGKNLRYIPLPSSGDLGDARRCGNAKYLENNSRQRKPGTGQSESGTKPRCCPSQTTVVSIKSVHALFQAFAHFHVIFTLRIRAKMLRSQSDRRARGERACERRETDLKTPKKVSLARTALHVLGVSSS